MTEERPIENKPVLKGDVLKQHFPTLMNLANQKSGRLFR